METLVFYELRAGARDARQLNQLLYGGSLVADVSRVRSRSLITIHQCSWLSAMVYDCDANSSIVGHVTVNGELGYAPSAVWVN